MTGLTLPASSNGQTFSRRARATSAFCATVRARRVEPVMREPLRQHGPEIELFDHAALSGGDLHEAPFQREDGQISGEIGAADHVEHDIDAAPLREGLNLGDEILRPVIDREIGSERAAEGAFFVGSGGGDHHRAEGFGELDRGRADAARSAVNEQRLARP